MLQFVEKTHKPIIFKGSPNPTTSNMDLREKPLLNLTVNSTYLPLK